MTKKIDRDSVIAKMADAKESHVRLAKTQRRMRSVGERPIINVGSESHHRRWAKVYDDVIELLEDV